jgi:glycosyltransferase involved in cell wall biosynthesis
MSMANASAGALVVWDTHPVQYRGPLYSLIARAKHTQLYVYYKTDKSLRGYHDIEFGRELAWDVPLMDGYDYCFLSLQQGGFRFGVLLRAFFRVAWGFTDKRPAACLYVDLNDIGTIVLSLVAALVGVPQWLRVETQDQAFRRSRGRDCLRTALWTILYMPFSRAFYIGELNRRHLMTHGFRSACLRPARYGVVDGVRNWSSVAKMQERKRLRQVFKIPADALLIGFCGKLIPKKDPTMLLKAYPQVMRKVERACHILYIGSGDLEESLRERAREWEGRVHFAGFINQLTLPGYYLAMDIFVLPSQRLGETWGLVVNEALHAGCAVAISRAAGCAADFGSWQRCRTFEPADVAGCAATIAELAAYPRDFDWCAKDMERYTLGRSAEVITAEMEALEEESANVI